MRFNNVRYFSCVVAAIGSLKGPLHGGANEAAMEMIENWKTREEAKANILDMLANKGKDYGFWSCDLL